MSAPRQRVDEAHRQRIEEARVVEVVRVRFTRGTGTDSDPIRLVTQWCETDGTPIAESDPYAPVPS